MRPFPGRYDYSFGRYKRYKTIWSLPTMSEGERRTASGARVLTGKRGAPLGAGPWVQCWVTGCPITHAKNVLKKKFQFIVPSCASSAVASSLESESISSRESAICLLFLNMANSNNCRWPKSGGGTLKNF